MVVDPNLNPTLQSPSANESGAVVAETTLYVPPCKGVVNNCGVYDIHPEDEISDADDDYY